MFNTKTIVAGVIGGIVYFLLGWVFYGMLLMDFFNENAGTATNVMRGDDEMIWWSLILGNIVWGYFIAYVFHHWAQISTWHGGAKGGALIGVLTSMGMGMIWYATSNIGTEISGFVDVVVGGLMSAIAGAVIGWWLGRGK